MTEPGTGSDLQAVRTTARRTDDGYVINGQKTFISNGQNCGVVVVVAKTDPAAAGAKGISLLVVETDEAEGFRRGRSEEHTSELQSLMRISYAVFCLKKNNTHTQDIYILIAHLSRDSSSTQT